MDATPNTHQLPPASEMHAALAARDKSYEGVFFAAIRTTGIFCRPGCPARTPNPENVLFVHSTQEALAAGYRPCKRCCPMQPAGEAPTKLTDKRQVLVTRITSPLGPLLAAADDRGLSLLEFTDRRALATQIKALQKSTGAIFAPGEHPHFNELRIQLDEYFAGQRRNFDIPLDLPGSPFQKACWQALQQIPYGQTRSYGEIAEQLGRPGASRAVGTANGQNRIAILVPCHRVIKADGTLSGYGGGLWRKHHLLELEQG